MWSKEEPRSSVRKVPQQGTVRGDLDVVVRHVDVRAILSDG